MRLCKGTTRLGIERFVYIMNYEGAMRHCIFAAYSIQQANLSDETWWHSVVFKCRKYIQNVLARRDKADGKYEAVTSTEA